MDIIFIGGFFPKQFTPLILSKSLLEVQNSANVFQWALIKGLEQNLKQPIKLITAPYIGWYPKYYKDLTLKTSYFSNGNVINSGIMVGFLNLPIIKNIYKFFNIYSSIINTCSFEDKTVLIVYSIDLAYLKAALKAKQKIPNSIVCVTINDLHEFPGGKDILHGFYIKYVERHLVYNLLSKVDCFIVVADKMVDFLKLHYKPYIRIEGIYDDQTDYEFGNTNHDEKNNIILYTGSLDNRYGIKELLDAFKLINAPDFRLWICGGGSGANLVMNRAQEDERIKYFGIVSKEKVIELQMKAKILVNPRNPIGEYNKYSFPIKTIEYMASGTPALIYKLDGIPKEYFDYCYIVEDNRIESLADAMYNVCQLDQDTLRLKGKTARDFILRTKTAKMQCGKLLNMIIHVYQSK
jgi:glycosyltransferase involved in cell wall biosynthesis